MSTETSDALEAAIRAHVSDSGDGAYLTDWIVIAAAAMPDDPDVTTYITETSDGPLHHRLGLVRYLALRSDDIAIGD
jgi:hypothetical protein